MSFFRLCFALFLLLPVAQDTSPGRLRTTVERLDSQRLAALHETRAAFALARKDLLRIGVYQDYRAVIHVHAEDSAHTRGTRQQVLEGASKAGVRVVLSTDQRFDDETQRRRFTAIGANDAHQNQIFRDAVFDPYEVSFRNVSTHILARELSDAEIRGSLRAGHAYVAHDWLCDPTGFSFVAVNRLGVFEMGDPVPMAGTTQLTVQTPLPARLKLIHRGIVVQETDGARLTFTASQPGPYRVEAWLSVTVAPSCLVKVTFPRSCESPGPRMSPPAPSSGLSGSTPPVRREEFFKWQTIETNTSRTWKLS